MKNLRLSVALKLLLIPIVAYAQQVPKNVIFLIGDGMGVSQITAALYTNNNSLALERIKHIGLIKTHSFDNLITDSAAGATAFACGKKTYNGAIAVDTSGTHLPTILEMAHNAKLSTGVIATSTIQHATPAAFYAHQPSRVMYEEITLDFLTGTVDIAIGGGMHLFNKRKDKRNLVVELEKKGYTFYDKLQKAQEIPTPRMMIITDKGHMSSARRRDKDFLAEAATFAAKELSKNANGFFLMVESSQIDWGGHSNDGDYIINEMLDFNNTIDKVLNFADHNKETLVIITADHETGGFSVLDREYNNKVKTAFTTDKHTAQLVPVFAYGPGAEQFSGLYDNTEIFDKLMKALRLTYSYDDTRSGNK